MIVSLQTKGKIRTRRFSGICKAAEHLGVARQTVYDVIHGHRRSRKIEAWLSRNLKVAP
jgi:hypothetical protein